MKTNGPLEHLVGAAFVMHERHTYETNSFEPKIEEIMFSENSKHDTDGPLKHSLFLAAHETSQTN